MCAQHLEAFVAGNYVIFLRRRVVNAFFLCRTDLQIHAKSFLENWSQTGAGVPPGGPERSKTAQGHPGALQEIPRDGQKASPRASGSALEALWARLERHWGVQEVTLRGDFEPKMQIDSGNADFLKSMLSPQRVPKWSPERIRNALVKRNGRKKSARALKMLSLIHI